jgi:S1-C subfamily serine protease
LVTAVLTHSPAADAGLQPDDVITAIDGYHIVEPNAFDYRLALMSTAGTTNLTIRRSGAETILALALAPAPETRARALTRIRSISPLQGATVANLSPALAEEIGLPTTSDGVAIVTVAKDTPADRIGFQPGDIVVRLNGTRMISAPELEKFLQHETLASFEIERGGERLTCALIRASRTSNPPFEDDRPRY